MTICTGELSPAVVAASVAISYGNSCGAESFDSVMEKCPLDDQEMDAFEELKRKPKELVDKQLLCTIMCCCREHPVISVNNERNQYQECVKQTLDTADDVLAGQSRYKAEISYDMISEETPTPLMHRDANGNDTTQRSTYWQKRAQDIMGYKSGRGHVRRPDVVIVKNPALPPYQNNIEKVVEMKFDDDIDEGQEVAYRRIAGDDKFLLIKEKEDCNCQDDEQEEPVEAPAYEKEEGSAHDTEDNDNVDWGAVGTTVGMGAVTLLTGAATVALLLCPFEGPAGESLAGTGTMAAAGATAAAFSNIFN